MIAKLPAQHIYRIGRIIIAVVGAFVLMALLLNAFTPVRLALAG